MKKVSILFATLLMVLMACSVVLAAEHSSSEDDEGLSLNTGYCREVTIGGPADSCTCSVILIENEDDIAIFHINENSEEGKSFMNRDIDLIRRTYPTGTTVRLNFTTEKQGPPAGTVGTVMYTDSAGQLVVAWEDGSEMRLIPGYDSFEKIG